MILIEDTKIPTASIIFLSLSLLTWLKPKKRGMEVFRPNDSIFLIRIFLSIVKQDILRECDQLFHQYLHTYKKA